MIMIATPTASDSVNTAFVKTLLSVVAHLQGVGRRTRYINAIGSDLVLNRNFLASRALDDPAVTHVLFIDSDMSFDGSVARRLLEADLPLIGCVYPKKTIDMTLVESRLAKAGTSLADAIAAASQFVVHTLAPSPRPVAGLQRVAGIGMGAALIRRDVLERLVASGSAALIKRDHTYRSLGLTGPAHDFFSPLRDEDGEFLSEDFSFCRRWRIDCGGEVVAVTDAAVGHVGPFTYAASYQRLVDQHRKPQLRISLRPPGKPETR